MSEKKPKKQEKTPPRFSQNIWIILEKYKQMKSDS